MFKPVRFCFKLVIPLFIGGFLFAKIMRKRGYITMLDPFQERYGIRVGGLMYIPAFLGELIWSAATLNSLGATISVVMNLPRAYSVIASACIAIFYTFLGGLWSVAYTDVAQLICMFIGMVSSMYLITWGILCQSTIHANELRCTCKLFLCWATK